MYKTTNHPQRYAYKKELRFTASAINVLFFFFALLIVAYLAIRINRNIEESRSREVEKVAKVKYRQ